MRASPRVWTVLGLVLACGCGPAVDRREEAGGTASAGLVWDGSRPEGTPGFYFRPPVAADRAYAGAFAPGLLPEVWIENLSTRAVVARFTRSTGTMGALVVEVAAAQQYQVDWNTKAYRLATGDYRVHVGLEDEPFELGFADVRVVATAQAMKRIDTTQYVPLLNGTNLPIKFRIEADALKCVGVRCTALDQCHVAGSCDTRDGTCTNPDAVDGRPCDDGSACTRSDACAAGACVGSNPVVCVALDQCHVAGSCDPGTGLCSDPAADDGATCSDGNPCTQADACAAGACVGSNPVVCAALDACHLAGTCNPASGSCSSPVAPDGTSCSDGNACTRTDGCLAGACVGSNPVVCTRPDACHLAGSCDPTSGACTHPPVADGTACNDGDACTAGEACSAGSCVATVANDVCTNGGALATTRWATPDVRTDTRIFTGHFTGSTRHDIVKFDEGSPGGVWVGRSTGSEFTFSKWADWYMAGSTQVLVGDFDGDRHDDIAKRDVSTGVVWVGLSTGSTFLPGVPWAGWPIDGTMTLLAGDFTGDGMTDVVGIVHADGGPVLVGRSNGSSFETELWGTPDTRNKWFRVGDFDGDGTDDIAMFPVGIPFVASPTDVWVGLSRAGAFDFQNWGQMEITLLSTRDVLVGDFDGNGRSDVAVFENGLPGRVSVSLSRGDRFDVDVWRDRLWLNGGMHPLVGDFNGDGRTDVAKLDAGSDVGGVYVGLTAPVPATGQLHFDTRHWAEWYLAPATRVLAADFDGDGRDDIAKFDLGTPGGAWVGLSRRHASGAHSDVVAVPIRADLTRYVRKAASGAFTLCHSSDCAHEPPQMCVAYDGDNAVCDRWSPDFEQVMEPVENYCGPTAGMNMMRWFASAPVGAEPLVFEPPASPQLTAAERSAYLALGDAMRTNSWPIPLGETFEFLHWFGTPGDQMGEGLAAYTPAGHRLVSVIDDGTGDVEKILYQLSRGNPVVELQSTGYHNVHWAVVNGSYLGAGGELWFRLANASDRNLDDFRVDWSTERYWGSEPGKTTEKLLYQDTIEGVFHIYPYEMFYYLPID